MRYKLQRSVAALKLDTGAPKKSFFFVPEGAVLETPLEFPEAGLIDALYEGGEIQVFAEDLRSRGDQL